MRVLCKAWPPSVLWVLGTDLESSQILNAGGPDSLATNSGSSRDHWEQQGERLATSQCQVGSARKEGKSVQMSWMSLRSPLGSCGARHSVG